MVSMTDLSLNQQPAYRPLGAGDRGTKIKRLIPSWCLGIFVVILFTGLPCPADSFEEEARALDSLASSYPAEENIHLGRLALIIARTVYPEINPQEYLNRLDQMAEEIKKKLRKRNKPEQIINAINDYIYKTKKIEAVPVSKAATNDKFLLNKVLDSGKGSCLGLATLYFSLAERLNLPLKGVVMPQHVFLEYDNGRTRRNIETTSGGRSLSKEDYIKNIKQLIGDVIEPYSIGQEIGFRRIRKRAFIGLILFNRGIAYSRQGKNTAAIKDFTRTIALDSDNYEAYKARGSAYLRIGEYTLAVADLTKAVEEENDCPSSLFNLATALGHLNQFNRAIEYYNRTLKLASDYTEVYQNRGVAYSMNKEYTEALADFNQALKLNPQDAPTYYNRGLVYMNTNQTRKAINDFTKTILLEPKYIEAYNNRGTIYGKQKRWVDAIADFKQIILINPDYTSAYKNLGITYYKARDYDDAAHYISKYLKRISKNASDWPEVNNLLDDIKRRLNR